ncbi:MAG: hypothetical protein IJ733_19720 [Lachnospiraceae bacterium]|nr:hypothetical protein [Lachnospiraceae bacterium]
MDKDGKKWDREDGEKMLQEQSDAVIGLLTDRGVLPETGISDEDIRTARQKRRKDAYHNTMLLLRYYRTIVWILECFPDNIAEELESPLQDVDRLIEQLDVEVSWGNKKLENRLETIERSRLLLDRVNDALTILKKKPENGEKLYQLIYLTYIGDEELNHMDIIYRLDISSRSYYRMRQQAVTILSIRLWSVPTAEMDVWMEMMKLIERMEE